MNTSKTLRFRITNPVTRAFRTVSAPNADMARKMAPAHWLTDLELPNPVSGKFMRISAQEI